MSSFEFSDQLIRRAIRPLGSWEGHTYSGLVSASRSLSPLAMVSSLVTSALKVELSASAVYWLLVWCNAYTFTCIEYQNLLRFNK